MKTYPPAVEAMIESGQVIVGHYVKLDFTTPLMVTDLGFDLEADSESYNATGMFQGMEELTRKAQMSVTELSMAFSMADQVIQSIVLGQSYHGTPVTIGRTFLDDNNQPLHVERIWSGRITNYSDDDKKALLNFTIKNVWFDFEMVNSWRTTLDSHQRRYPGDRCFKYAAKAAETIYWAGTASGGSRAARTGGGAINKAYSTVTR